MNDCESEKDPVTLETEGRVGMMTGRGSKREAERTKVLRVCR